MIHGTAVIVDKGDTATVAAAKPIALNNIELPSGTTMVANADDFHDTRGAERDDAHDRVPASCESIAARSATTVTTKPRETTATRP